MLDRVTVDGASILVRGPRLLYQKVLFEKKKIFFSYQLHKKINSFSKTKKDKNAQKIK